MPNLKRVDILLMIAILIAIVVGYYYLCVLGPDAFEEVYTIEDGFIEYATALALAVAAMILITQGVSIKKSWMTKAVLVLLGLILLFGAGEEVSWGQRIFGFDTPEDLKEINKQDEFNLHNIRIGDLDINKLIFSKVLSVCIAAYFLLGPWLPSRWPWFEQITSRFELPLPTWMHSIFFMVASAAVLLMSSSKKAELHEYVFGLTLLAIVWHHFYYRPKHMS